MGQNWGVCPFWEGELGPHLTQCGRCRGLPPCQVSFWSIQPFGHNTPTSQTDRTGQRSNSTGQTILQMVAQKPIKSYQPSSFSALTLLVGRQEGHPAGKNWVVRYWRGYLSEARCKWFAYGPADATANPSSLVPVKSRMVFLSGAGLPTLTWKRAVKWM